MKLIIHRGTNQIVGSVTEYEHNGWRLFVDFGEQLPGAVASDPLDIDGLTKGNLSKSAMLITHYHGDHIGNIHLLPDTVPVFMGKLGLEIQKITSNHLKGVDEIQAQKQLEKEFQRYKYNIVYLSSTNINRLFSLYHAALRMGILFIVDSHQKRIVDVVVNSSHIWAKSSLYKYGKYEPMVLMYNKKNPKEFLISERLMSFLQKKGYILITRNNPRFYHLIDQIPGAPKQYYLSMWNDVNAPTSPSYNKELATTLGKEYLYRHTSGHCDMKSLNNLFTRLSPKVIIPIHTDAPEEFAKYFNNQWIIGLLQDGDSFMLHS